MPKCGYTLDMLKKIQSTFNIYDEDLLLIQHQGSSKVISIKDIKNYINYKYPQLPLISSKNIESGTNKVEITGNFSDCTYTFGNVISRDESDPAIFITQTIINDNKIIFYLSSEVNSSNYYIQYVYYIDSTYVITDSVILDPGIREYVVEGKFSNIDQLSSKIVKGSDGESVAIEGTFVSNNTLTFYFSKSIPSYPTYRLIYSYINIGG